MKNEDLKKPFSSPVSPSNTGDPSERTPLVVLGLKALIEEALRYLDQVATVPPFSGQQLDRLHSLFGALFDVLDGSEDLPPADRNESEAKVEGGGLSVLASALASAQVIGMLGARLQSTLTALENVRAFNRELGDERDRLKSALQIVSKVQGKSAMWGLPPQVRAAVVAALDPAPVPRDEWTIDDHERPRRAVSEGASPVLGIHRLPKVIRLGPVAVCSAGNPCALCLSGGVCGRAAGEGGGVA